MAGYTDYNDTTGLDLDKNCRKYNILVLCKRDKRMLKKIMINLKTIQLKLLTTYLFCFIKGISRHLGIEPTYLFSFMKKCVKLVVKQNSFRF